MFIAEYNHLARIPERHAGSPGRPAYHPAVLLKIYIYGYLTQCSRAGAGARIWRNVELMWLTGRLEPDFETIDEFRRSNAEGIRNVCRRFVTLCRDPKLLVVAIDSSKCKAVNSRDQNFTPNKIQRRQEQIEQGIQRYLDELETGDRTQPIEVEAKTKRPGQKTEMLREQMRDLARAGEILKSLQERQISLTAPDFHSMTSQAKSTGVVGNNLQVDARHHLIVAHDVANVGSDPTQLSRMAQRWELEAVLEAM